MDGQIDRHNGPLVLGKLLGLNGVMLNSNRRFDYKHEWYNKTKLTLNKEF